MSMIERMAKALVDTYPLDSGESPLGWADVTDVVRAQLSALSEYLEAVQSGYDLASEHGGSADAAVASAGISDVLEMIYAALAEEGSTKIEITTLKDNGKRRFIYT